MYCPGYLRTHNLSGVTACPFHFAAVKVGCLTSCLEAGRQTPIRKDSGELPFQGAADPGGIIGHSLR